MRYAMPNRRGRTLTNFERALSSETAYSERSNCMSIYTSEIMEEVAVARQHAKRYDLSRRAHSAPTIAVSRAAFGHNFHKVTPQIRLYCGSVRRDAASVSATSYCIFRF